MSFYEFDLLVKRDVIPVLILKNPRMTNSGSPNHYSVTSRMLFDSLNVCHTPYIAIANHGYFYCLFDFCNCIPICLAEKKLRSRSSVYGNERSAIVFENSGYFQIISGLIVPSQSNLAGYGNAQNLSEFTKNTANL